MNVSRKIVDEIDDALIASKELHLDDKIIYFMILGMEYEKVFQYYSFVKTLEKQFNPWFFEIDLNKNML